MTYKECCDCKKWKPITEFVVCKYNKDGHTKRCKECQNIYQMALYRTKQKARMGKDWPCKGCVKRSGKWCMRLRKSVEYVAVCPVREERRDGKFEKVIYE